MFAVLPVIRCMWMHLFVFLSITVKHSQGHYSTDALCFGERLSE